MHFSDKPIGHITTLIIQVDKIQLRVHCQNDDGYVTKTTSCFGTLIEVEDHQTRQHDNGESYNFNYPDKMLIHKNETKHLVHNVNNWCHDPISLADSWKTSW